MIEVLEKKWEVCKMAELHKISGYLLDIDGAYCEGEIVEVTEDGEIVEE